MLASCTKRGYIRALIVALMSATTAEAADWPTYRADAARSGYTAEELPRELATRWIFHPRHAPQPAWPGPKAEPKPSSTTAARISFDRAFQALVAGGKLFFGNSADCHVYALDAATGRELWSFCTDGPVRVAPPAWETS